MAKYRKNEEAEHKSFVSPSEKPESISTNVISRKSKKPQFEVSYPHSGHNFALGGKYYNTGSKDWVSPGGRVYKGIANDQEAMKEIYEFGPISKTWVKAPEGYRPKWEKFIN